MSFIKNEAPALAESRDLELQVELERARELHTKDAPGLIIGVYMVDLALELLQPLKGKVNAIVETSVCLADPIQLMTGCTLGNKYLHVYDFGRYAMSLYDRKTKEGIRVLVDYDRIDRKITPWLKGFFDDTPKSTNLPRPEQQVKVTEDFLKVKRGCLSWQKVWVNLSAKPPLASSHRCPVCGEWFKVVEERQICRSCSDELVYCVDSALLTERND